MGKLTEQAKVLEAAIRSEDDYELMIRCANDEDESGMIYVGTRLGVTINADDAWSLIDVYQTRGSAY